MKRVIFGLTISSSWGNGHATDVGSLYGYREAIGLLSGSEQRLERQESKA